MEVKYLIEQDLSILKATRDYMIIGSMAEIIYSFGFLDDKRDIKDLDICIGKDTEIPYDIIEFARYNGLRIERHDIPPLLKYLSIIYDTDIYKKFDKFYHQRMLLTLRASHLSWHSHRKNRMDKDFKSILNLTVNTGARRISIKPWLYYQLREHWEKKLGKIRLPDFTLSPEEFFDDKVSRIELHDDLHHYINHKGYPIYQDIQDKSSNTVEVLEDKFNRLELQSKYAVIEEEVVVLCIERDRDYFIKHPNSCYLKWLHIVIARLCPIWMSIWAVDRYDQLRYRCRKSNADAPIKILMNKAFKYLEQN